MRVRSGVAVACLASLAAGAAGAASKPYVPWIDPEEPWVDGRPIVWRGDQRHATRLPARGGDGADVYRMRSFRWTFRLEEGGPYADHWRAIFADAVLDASKVTRISLLLYPFSPEIVAGHTALLLHVEDGGLAPGAGVGGDLGPPPTGLVISLEARMKRGEKYGFTDGATGKFPVVYSVSTWENYVQRCVDVYQGELLRWELALEDHEVPLVARAAMDVALADHRDETYWLTRNSCSTAVMDILIEGLRRSRAASRAADVAALEESARATEGVDLGELAGAVARWTARQVRETLTLTKTRRWLGIHRDSVRREGLGGILVNPLMSFPARLPGVLERRGLLEDAASPDETLSYEDPETGEATGAERSDDPDFLGLSGS